MHIKTTIIFILAFLFSFFWFSNTYSASFDSSPSVILRDMKDGSVQKTALDDVDWDWIEDTLSSIKEKSTWYIDWLAFIWLSIALVLIIYNGIYLLANFSNENKFSKIKKRFISIILGVVVFTSWYLIIKVVVSIISNIF